MRGFFTTILSLSCLLCSVIALQAEDQKTRAAENMIITAADYYNNGEFTKAESILKDVVREFPDNDAGHFYLGLTEFCLNDADAAEAELEEAARLDPSNFWYRYRLAMVYSATGKEELTLKMFEEMVEDFPKKYDLYYTMVELYRSQGQQEKALSTLDQIETVFGSSDMTALARFDLLREMGREDEGYGYLEDFNRKYSSVQVLSILGDRQLSMYNDSSAVALYDEALDLDSSFTPALLGKAEAYRITRKYDKYFSVLYDFASRDDVPLENKCSYLNALVRSVDQMFLKSFGPQMDSLVNICNGKYPGDSSVTFLSGIYYYAKGDTPKAKACFRANAEKWPESLSAAATYVEMLMYMKDWDELVAEAEKAAARFPSEPAFWEYAGMGEYNRGNYGKVIDICGKVLSIAPSDSATVLNAYTTMGDMYYHTGDKKKAYKSYDKALEINPDYLPVLNNYAYFLSMDGKKLKKAYEMSRKTVELDPDNSTYLDTFGWISVVLDHYAEVLFALKEYDLAFLYWNQAKAINNGQIEDLDSRISERKSQMKKDGK